MKCDLCKHQDIRSENNLLCGGCAEMIERLFITQQCLDSHQSQTGASDLYSVELGAWID
jgi:hypothetical protein